MKRQDLIGLAIAAGVTAAIALVVSLLIFSPPKHNESVPVVQPISNSMPDIKNDANYNAIFNNTALDPAQPLSSTNNQNNTPFKTGN